MLKKLAKFFPILFFAMSLGLLFLSSPSIIKSQSSWPDSCQVSKGQTEDGQGCDMQIDEIPQCPGQGYGWYWREIIEEDDDGSIAHDDELVFEVPDDSQTYTGVSIRMHDHEKNMCFTIEGSTDGESWQELESNDIHTSGGDCNYDCSKNTNPDHPPGNQGCPDPIPEPGPEEEWFHEPYDQWHNRADWPCAVSFDEHYINFGGSNNYRYIKLKVRDCEGKNDDQHIHVHDVLWQKCGSPPVTNTPPPTEAPPTNTPAAPGPPAPQCTSLNITAEPGGTAITDYSVLKLNQEITLKCGATAEGGQDIFYQFRVFNPSKFRILTPNYNPENIDPSFTSGIIENTYINYTIPEYGRFVAQCRVCTHAAESTCQGWGPLPGSNQVIPESDESIPESGDQEVQPEPEEIEERQQVAPEVGPRNPIN